MSTIIPEVYLKNKTNNNIKYRLAYEWNNKAIIVCIPNNGEEPHTITINKNEMSAMRIYRR